MVNSSEKLLSSIGEFGLIKFIKKNNTRALKEHNVKIDIGDDCFVFAAGKNARYAVTSDILIENIHFKTKWSSPEQIAAKAVEVNVSDIASMGCCKPLYMFVSAGFPEKTKAAFAKKFFIALKKNCDKYSIHIAGGDTVKADKLTVSITLIGLCLSDPVSRSGAKESDIICVSGSFGDSGAGFDILNSGKINLKQHEKKLVRKHLEPEARLDIAYKMFQNNIKITSMTDSSDGLLKSVELLTSDYKKGAVIYLDKIPVSSELSEFSKKDKRKIYHYALNGAEEFELVFTIAARDKAKLQKILPSVSVIGSVDNSGKIKYFDKGIKTEMKYDGFKHF